MVGLLVGKKGYMILDNLKGINNYNLNLDFIRDYLEKNEFIKGKFNISEHFFGIGLEYITQDASNALWEAHRKYLDVHCILEGEEIIEISNIDKMNTTNNYEE